MANCPTCGSKMAHFENPPRDICPTPERHKATRNLRKDVVRNPNKGPGGKNKKGNK